MYEARYSPPDRPWRRSLHYSTATYTPNGEYSAKPPRPGHHVDTHRWFCGGGLVITEHTVQILPCQMWTSLVVKNNTKHVYIYIGGTKIVALARFQLSLGFILLFHSSIFLLLSICIMFDVVIPFMLFYPQLNIYIWVCCCLIPPSYHLPVLHFPPPDKIWWYACNVSSKTIQTIL